MTHAIGACYINPHVLAEALPLPIDTEVLGAEWDPERKELLLLFRHQDVPQGAGLPTMTCVIHTERRDATAYDSITTKVAQWVMPEYPTADTGG